MKSKSSLAHNEKSQGQKYPLLKTIYQNLKSDVSSIEKQFAQFQKVTGATKAEIEQIKNNLDSMSEMGETESLRLQMAMDRMSKMMTTLSNILKKMDDTQKSIIKNLK